MIFMMDGRIVNFGQKWLWTPSFERNRRVANEQQHSILDLRWNNKAVADVFGIRASARVPPIKGRALHPAQTPNARGPFPGSAYAVL